MVMISCVDGFCSVGGDNESGDEGSVSGDFGDDGGEGLVVMVAT